MPTARGVTLAHTAFRPPLIVIVVAVESSASSQNELTHFSADASQQPFKGDPGPPQTVVLLYTVRVDENSNHPDGSAFSKRMQLANEGI